MNTLENKLKRLSIKYGDKDFNQALENIKSETNTNHIYNKCRNLKDAVINTLTKDIRDKQELDTYINLINKITSHTYKYKEGSYYDNIKITITFDCRYKYVLHVYEEFCSQERDRNIYDTRNDNKISIEEFSTMYNLEDFGWDSLDFVTYSFLVNVYPECGITECIGYKP